MGGVITGESGQFVSESCGPPPQIVLDHSGILCIGCLQSNILQECYSVEYPIGYIMLAVPPYLFVFYFFISFEYTMEKLFIFLSKRISIIKVLLSFNK